MAADCKSLGRFDLVGIPPAPRGIPQVEVSFDIDANGLVHVTAKDLGTGKAQSIKITASEKLSKEDMERMKQDAEQHAEEDKQKKEAVETKIQADALVYTIEKTATDLKGKIDEKDLADLEKEKNELKELIIANNMEKAKAKMEDINKKLQAATTKLYENVQKTQPEQPTPNDKKGKKKDNVVDAEVVDNDTEDK